MSPFHHVLVNTLLANVTTSHLWFCLSFWIYLETRNVGLTGLGLVHPTPVPIPEAQVVCDGATAFVALMPAVEMAAEQTILRRVVPSRQQGRDAFGRLPGEGTTRGMALMFLASSAVVFVVVVPAFFSRPHRRLSEHYAATSQDLAGQADGVAT